MKERNTPRVCVLCNMYIYGDVCVRVKYLIRDRTTKHVTCVFLISCTLYFCPALYICRDKYILLYTTW